MARIKGAKPDAYDGDKDTVSVYDGMEHHAYVDKYQKDYGIENDLAQKPHKPDAYDGDKDTVSPYDAEE